MRASKKEVEDAILCFAKRFGQEEAYKVFVESNSGLPEIIKLLVYEMFLRGYMEPVRKKVINGNSYIEEQENFETIHRYATELRKNGFVVHE